MKITCEDNHSYYIDAALGKIKPQKVQAYLGFCILDWALNTISDQNGDLARSMCFQNGQIVCSFDRVNEIKLHTCDYTVDFQLYNQVFFASRNLNILFRLLSSLSFPKFQEILLC